MDNVKIVKFKTETIAQKYEQDASSLGVVLSQTKETYSVLFFNVKNIGDYAVFKAPQTDFIITDYELPPNVLNALNDYLLTHSEEVKNKQHFEKQPFRDSDYVEVITDEYLKQGVRRGDKGVVVYERAVKGSILVDFSTSHSEEKCISVNVKDLKKI